jgi:hypothetical protein
VREVCFHRIESSGGIGSRLTSVVGLLLLAERRKTAITSVCLRAL